MTCPKYVEFYSKNKFEKLVHLIGFIIRIIEGTLAVHRGTFMNSCGKSKTAMFVVKTVQGQQG
jgi:hypothetical protein